MRRIDDAVAHARADHDDMPALAFQIGDSEFASVVDAEEIDAQGPLPVRNVAVFDRVAREVAAGVGDHDIDRSEAGAGFDVKARYSDRVADIAGDGKGVAAGATNRVYSFVDLRKCARGADDFGALPGESDGDGASDAAASAGDDGDFACELVGHGSIFLYNLLAEWATHRVAPTVPVVRATK